MKDFLIDGHEISIKLMDSSYIMGENERSRAVTVDIDCRHMSPSWPNPLYSTYYRKLLEAYDIGPVLLWEGRRVVGFLPLTIIDCGIPQLPLCIHYTGGLDYCAEEHIDLRMIEEADPIPFDRLSPKEIRIGCMCVHPSLRGNSLSATMIRFVIDEAGKRGWGTIRARPMIDNEPYSFYPTVSFWKRLGFDTVGSVRTFGPGRNAWDRSKAIDIALRLDRWRKTAR